MIKARLEGDDCLPSLEVVWCCRSRGQTKGTHDNGLILDGEAGHVFTILVRLMQMPEGWRLSSSWLEGCMLFVVGDQRLSMIYPGATAFKDFEECPPTSTMWFNAALVD